MALRPEQIDELNANEARKRELRVKLARVKGQLDASASASKFFARINQDTQIQRDELERELVAMEEGGAAGVLDAWGRLSTFESAARKERRGAKERCYGWLAANPAAEQQACAAELGRLMLEQRTAAGRPWLLQDPLGLLSEWQANAHAAGLIAENTWLAFRTWLLGVGREAALAEPGAHRRR